MSCRRLSRSTPLAALALLVLHTATSRAGEGTLTYEQHVRPILKAHCFQCHGETDPPKAKLDLRLVRLMHQGGHSGPAVVPGKPEDSELWKRIQANEMPKGPKKLSAEQKTVLRTWITQGARTARPEPADPNQARFTEEERSFWAFQPVRQLTVPAVPADFKIRNPVDAFLAEKLAAQGLHFSPEADPRTLIRRATYDLTGLPPTPAEVEAFLADGQPDAYERLLDRLLASPHYGERWGRHWLDVAGFAETDGNPGTDRPRAGAYRYRDYVIQSFNAHKPFDRFLVEQLAGDELANRPLDLKDPATVELLTATGFLRMAPDATETNNSPAERHQAVAEVIKVVTSGLLGLTVGCAQCHDHRYDPISQVDYYRWRAVFDPALDCARWQPPSQRQLDVTTVAARAEADRIEAEAKKLEATLDARAAEAAKKVYARELAKVPEADRAAAQAAVETSRSKRTPEQVRLLKVYPNIRELSFIKGFLVEYDPPVYRELEKERAKVLQIRGTKPPADLLMVLVEPPGAKTESRVLQRGDPEQPTQVVTPAELPILAHAGQAVEVPTKDPNLSTTGRRLAYARRLTDGTHPLVARVLVNRMWMHHFGKGIVNTPGDFGFLGERPSHPELLDWLATDFVTHGWSLPRLHKLLMTSTAYRQQSQRTPELDRLDPDNRLLARMSIRRLEAEAVRDALLAVGGDLNGEMYGPAVPVSQDSEGRAILARRQMGRSLRVANDPVGNAVLRRSVYVQVRRELPLSILETFDLPVMTPNCDLRRSSTGPTQALLFLNDPLVLERSEKLAERLERECPEDDSSLVHRAYALLYASEPTASEVAACLAFLEDQQQHYRQQGAKSPRHQALANLSQALLCSNRFLYVD